ncbi:MAG: hypothetical protein ACREN6_13580 [Gemmatimonadaceae bacterium]
MSSRFGDRAPKSDRKKATDEEARVVAELGDRVRRRGVSLLGNETMIEIAALSDAIDAFEGAVESAGGDLFVDEPADAQRAVSQPDDSRFVLPTRRPHESVASLLERISAATDRLRK